MCHIVPRCRQSPYGIGRIRGKSPTCRAAALRYPADLQEYCPLCRVLQERAGQAIKRQLALVSQRDLAKVQQGQAVVDYIETLIREARNEREHALADYRAHRAGHGDGQQAEGASE